ncbi:MAG TPA: hypothetical protein DCZ91_21365 [Lachnospiraceae bacterium]|nr:hypothetical protein [Lachnospiraceae bacterium]
MYVDRRRRRWPWLVLAAAAVLAVIIVWHMTVPASGRDMEEESIVALREAVERSARQCYAVEGFYPPSLEYLEENYGLQINTDEFRVVYDVFASNIAPTIQVLSRQ